MDITLTINGKSYSQDVEPRLLLIHFVRDVAGLTGTHMGCETSLCGACTVELNGKAIKSCTMFAVQANGADIVTVEGLASDGKLDPMQEAFWNEHGLQCGFCTPGMIMASKQIHAASTSVHGSNSGALRFVMGSRATSVAARDTSTSSTQ